MREFGREYPESGRILVSLEPRRRKTADGVLILPYTEFLADLWNGLLF
ncbi:MAG: hypothetical protein HS115_19860 [Spirochaetales bacterium]|nr:hypothetical protein [Spirochaetales bacterium]